MNNLSANKPSGMSATTAELVGKLANSPNSIVVIDEGQSYRAMCERFGGTPITIDTKASPSLFAPNSAAPC